jgi:hypothetical protein
MSSYSLPIKTPYFRHSSTRSSNASSIYCCGCHDGPYHSDLHSACLTCGHQYCDKCEGISLEELVKEQGPRALCACTPYTACMLKCLFFHGGLSVPRSKLLLQVCRVDSSADTRNCTKHKSSIGPNTDPNTTLQSPESHSSEKLQIQPCSAHLSVPNTQITEKARRLSMKKCYRCRMDKQKVGTTTSPWQ